MYQEVLMLDHVCIKHNFCCWRDKKIKWKDVAEFERRELLKMRVHHALRKASTAILARFSIREILDYFVKTSAYKRKPCESSIFYVNNDGGS